MGQAMMMRRGGGGAKLRLAGGAVQPANPKPNTLWINTAAPLGKLTVQADAPPAPAAGDVWLQTVATAAPHVVMAHGGLAYYVGFVWLHSGAAWARAYARYYDTAWHDVRNLWMEDHFNRANNTLGLGAADSGQVWQQTAAEGYQIVNNRAVQKKGSSNDRFYLPDAPPNGILTYTYTGGTWGPRLTLRGPTGDSSDGVLIIHYHTTSGATNHFGLRVNGTYIAQNQPSVAVGGTPITVWIYDEQPGVTTRIKVYVAGTLIFNHLHTGEYLNGTFLSFGGNTGEGTYDDLTYETL